MKTLVAFFVIVMLIMAVTAIAQEKKAGETSVTGCLNKGDAAGTYVLTEENTNKKITATGDPATIDRHANNHKVTLTGTMAKEKDKDVLKVTNLKMIAVCQ
jgi:hypothetical protein